MSLSATMRRAGVGLRTTRAGRRRAFAALMLVPLGAALAVPAAASASSSSSNNLLKQGLKFYNGKTVTLIAPDAPGATYDVASRELAPAMSQYLHANVQVVNYPLAHTIPGQDTTAHATPDGLTLGWMNTLSDVANQVEKTPFINFNPEKVAFIGATAPGSTLWFLQPAGNAKCPWTNWGSLISGSSASNPITSIDVGGSGDLYMHLANYAFKITPKFVTGYSNSSGGVQGFQRGDACMDTAQPTAVQGLLSSGKLVPIALSNAVSPQNAFASFLTSTPTIAQLVKQYPPKTQVQRLAAQAVVDIAHLDGHIMFTAPKIAADKLAALRAAFQFASRDPSVEHQVLLTGGNIGYVSGVNAKALYDNGVKEVARISNICGCLGGTTG